MRIAYADPPYIGQANRHYKNDPSGIAAAEVDHTGLIAHLNAEYPDGWALSLSSNSLFEVVCSIVEAEIRSGQYAPDPEMPLTPMGYLAMIRQALPEYRIAAWVKPWASFKPGVNPAYAWEPVIWRGGRKKRSRKEPTVRDWVAASITLKRGTHGAKPEPFCFWLFDLLGLRPGDTLDDLYPGSRSVTRAWQRYQRQLWTA